MEEESNVKRWQDKGENTGTQTQRELPRNVQVLVI